MKRFLVSCLLLALTASACASPDRKAGLPNGADPSVGASASINETSGTGAGTNVPHASGSNRPPTSNTKVPPAYGNSPPPGAIVTDDAVKARVNENVIWGNDCPRFERGDRCRVPFEGNYVLLSQRAGFLVFEARENGSKVPAASQRVQVEHGAGPFKTALAYTVGLTAKTVTFQAILLGADQKELDRSREYTVSVTGA